jgi:type II secretory pathway pseudopilin PulG
MAEIMVTIVIIGISAAIVIPSISDTTDTQVVASARTIAADLQYAQNLAITTQANVYVVFNNSGKSYSLSNNANASPPVISPITSMNYTVAFGPNNGFSGLGSLTANFGGAATMYFDLLGAPHGAGTVQVVAGPHVYVVTVAPATGKISVASTGL